MKTLVKNSAINNRLDNLSKSQLRTAILKKRDGLSQSEYRSYSSRISDSLTTWDIYKECEELLVYVSFRSEVDTYGIISDALNQNKKVYCPKVFGDDMLFYQISSIDELKSGYMGICEPVEGLPNFDYSCCKSLVIMPGSVFDRYGNRIGYGKGYYDRFLSDCYKKGVKPVTAALAFSLQIIDEVPAEEHDFKTDYIFTEKEKIIIKAEV